MKIVIFEPHPDDLLFGPGPIMFDWINKGHEIHVVTITDGRACCREGGDVFSPEIGELSESLRHYLAGKVSSDHIKNLNNVGEEIADVVAWISSLANLLEIDLEKAVLEKYPNKCIKCGSKPCQCPKSD